jgi:hypothetical protein
MRAAEIAAGKTLRGVGNQFAFSQKVEFPPIKLRGYGTLSGEIQTTANRQASFLRITCEDEAKAKLVLAKYLSDLQMLGSVTSVPLPELSSHARTFQAGGQGTILAARDGSNVDILAAVTRDVLIKLAQRALPSDRPLIFEAETKVPMALDRFDKYGLQCYYHPYTVPPISSANATPQFDPIKDFTFAQEENHMGLVLAQEPEPQQTAGGISKANSLDWVQRMAGERQIPLGINLDVYNTFALMNRFPEQIIQYQPQFFGGWYGSMNFGEEIVSWNGIEAKDFALGEVQDSIRDMAKNPNITDWLEAHSEMGHGIADYMVEFGPVADEGYRRYLRSHYDNLASVSERWFGDANILKSWDDVHVPELYSFLGWGPDAIDLTGAWRISYDAPFEATSASPALDDSAWPTVQAPGHALLRFLPRKPAVFRRHLTVDPAYRRSHDRIWIYSWDFNDNRIKEGDPRSAVQIFVNGQLIPEIPRYINESHWIALEVTRELVDGDNLITIDLPKGMFNGRAYLSPHEPLLYPQLGSQMNARWADFADWNRRSREEAVNRGSQMIRQVSPLPGIKLAAPADYVDGIQNTARSYGGDLHDTGAMAGFWNERLSALMRGAGLPVSAEPGGPAHSAQELQNFFGRWITEAVNQIDYFQELGDLEWNPEIRQCLDENRTIFTSIGKYHAPVAQVAALYSSRNSYLTDFPWNSSYYPGANPGHLGSGYWPWNTRALLRNYYESDGVSESSFANGDASRYSVVLDTNTSIMDEKLLTGIEKYVRDGGVFVTFVQTGRGTSAVEDAWPIERLTGYHVTALNQKKPWQTDAIQWADHQAIFSGDWIDQTKADGLSLKKIAPDAQDLAYWKSNGSVAIGLRSLGKGFIIQLGCRFTKGGLPQRIDYDLWNYYKSQASLEAYGLPPTTEHGLLSTELHATRELFVQILKWRKIEPMPMQFQPDNEHVMLRHDISNNGLYDVWSLWNDSLTDSMTGNLVFHLGTNPKWSVTLKDGKHSEVVQHQISIHLAPCETSIYITPRDLITSAPEEWFKLQRNWWQGTADPGKPFPASLPKLTVDLTPDWAFKPLDPKADAAPLADPQFNDSDWKRMELGIFSLPDYPEVKHAFFRKRFMVPAAWNKGRVQMSIQYWNGNTILDRGSIYLDGKLIPNATDGLIDNDLNGALRAGTSHVLAIEVTSGQSELVGVRGPAWISYHPDPAARLDLSGVWESSPDDLHFAPVTLPGTLEGTAARRTVRIDAAQSARTVVVHALGDGRFLRGLIINGRFVTPHHHFLSPEENINITPWVKFGQDNELILLSGGKGVVKEVTLEFHDKGTYP